MRFDPFELADRLIKESYKVPIMVPTEMVKANPKGSFMTCDHYSNVPLGELLEYMRRSHWKLQKENRELKAKIADYEPVLVDYSKRPTRTWTSGSPGEYDPMSGWTGEISGTVDDYKEARSVVKKWITDSKTVVQEGK